jgi:hypothetical protein
MLLAVPLVLAYLQVPQSAALPELRVLVSHAPPSSEQLGLLELPRSELDAKAKALQVTVKVQGDNTLMWVDELYDVKSVDLQIRANIVTAEQLKQGKNSFKLSDLAEEDRKAVRETLIKSSAAEFLGPAVLDDSATLQLGATHYLNLKGSDKSIDNAIAGEQAPSPPSTDIKRYTEAEMNIFQERTLPALRGKTSVYALRAAFNKVRLPSSRRAQAVEDVAKYFRTILERQSLDQQRVALLCESATQSRFPVKVGGSLESKFSDQLRSNKFTAERYGFKSLSEWGKFLDESTVTSARTAPTLSLRAIVGGKSRSATVSISPERGQ